MSGAGKLPRVVITVRGGVVQDVSCDNPIEFLVVDHDNINAGDEFDPTFEEIEAEPKRIGRFAAGNKDG